MNIHWAFEVGTSVQAFAVPQQVSQPTARTYQSGHRVFIGIMQVNSGAYHPVRRMPRVQLQRVYAATAANLLQSCPILCDPIDGSPPGSPIPGILQAKTLEWVDISFSNAWKWKVKVMSLSRVQLLTTSWTAAYQAPLSMGFSRQEHWSEVPLPSLRECIELTKTRLSFPDQMLWHQHYSSYTRLLRRK